MLELMRLNMTTPLNYIFCYQLYRPIISQIVSMRWEPANENLMYCAIRLGVLMIMREPSIRHCMKELSFLKVFCDAKRILSDKHVLYLFPMPFLKGNTLTIMQLTHKSQLFQHAREMAKEPICDSSSAKFIKDTIPYFGSISILLVAQLLNVESESDVLETIFDIPIYFKIREASKVFSMLTEIEGSLVKMKKQTEKKLFIVRLIIINAIHLIFYWSWLKFCHAQGICTSHSASEFMAYFHNPLLFKCRECNLFLCIPCASRHHHPFTSLEYCGSSSEPSKCSCSTSLVTSCNCKEGTTTMISLKFLNRIEVMRLHGLMLNGRFISQVPNEEYYGISLGLEEGPVELETAEPLFSIDEMRNENELTLSYYEVEVKSGGMMDRVTIGISGFEYRGDTGIICVDGQTLGIGPMFGSYDIIGVGITHNLIYLTYNGLLLRPLYHHPVNTDYRLRITMQGAETTLHIKLNTKAWLFKPPFDSTIEDQKFIPDFPDYVNESFIRSFIKKMQLRLKDCDSYRNVPELARTVLDIKTKAESVLRLDYKCLMKRRQARLVEQSTIKSPPKRPKDPCMLF